MSNNIRNIGISLQEVVKNTEKGLYLIPKFQRHFVWKKNDIIDLGDSIIRGYPISSLLLMAENGSLKVKSHNLIKDETFSHQENKIQESDTDTKLYILDGQQRMTSIAKLFLACDSQNEYYYDLLAILVDKFPKNKVGEDPAFTKPIKSVESLCCAFKIGKDKSEHPTRESYRYISGKNIISNKFGSVVNKFLKTLKNASDENIDEYTDYLNAILGSISSYNISATEISGDSELGIVIRVFEKVNSTGKKLTLFDLINAKSYQVITDDYSDGLSAFFSKRIDSMTIKEPLFEKSARVYFGFNKQELYEELARIVRIFEITYLLNNSQLPAIFNRNMLNREPSFWFDMWISNETILFKTIKWLYEQMLIDIAPAAFIEYIIAVFLANPKALNNPIFKNEVKKYALYLALSANSFNKSNLDIVEKFNDLASHLDNSHEFNKLDFESLSNKPNLTASKILEYTASKSEFRAVLNILYKEKPEGKFDRDISGHQITLHENDFDLHHIYPKSRVAEFTRKSPFNSIANMIYIHNSTNREMIKDKSPASYFANLRNKIGFEKFSQFCNQNLIDFHAISKVDNENKALDFTKERAAKIAEIVNNYF